jgi:undecaprenyl diphosphate synthase
MTNEKDLIVPKHLALIPDGNRRWAKTHGLEIFRGHSSGIKKFVEFARWSKDRGIKMITVWGLSTENLSNRPTIELKALFNLYIKAARDESLRKMLYENGIKLRIIGNLSVLPAKLRDALMDIERKTRGYGDYTINLLINYGGRDDLVYSARQIAKESKKRGVLIDEKFVERNLRTAMLPDVDMIIRTSGEQRLSGLLPWQAAYSELYFSDRYWPDFRKKDFDKAIKTFSSRQRRFGK